MTSSTDTMIGGPICHGVIPATLLDHEDRVLSAAARQSLWALFVEIGRCWGNLDDDSASVHSSWLEFVEAKTTRRRATSASTSTRSPSSRSSIGSTAREGVLPAVPTQRHPRRPADDAPGARQALRRRRVHPVQIVAGGFKGFAKPAS